jgi:hypothetical protein
MRPASEGVGFCDGSDTTAAVCIARAGLHGSFVAVPFDKLWADPDRSAAGASAPQQHSRERNRQTPVRIGLVTIVLIDLSSSFIAE